MPRYTEALRPRESYSKPELILTPKMPGGATPLIFGAYNLEKTKLLVAKGADVNAATDLGTRPLWVAASTHDNAGAVRHLIEHGADPKAVSRNGTDFLQRAAMFSEPEVVRFLLD